LLKSPHVHARICTVIPLVLQNPTDPGGYFKF
jgi:hypothetical protein